VLERMIHPGMVPTLQKIAESLDRPAVRNREYGRADLAEKMFVQLAEEQKQSALAHAGDAFPARRDIGEGIGIFPSLIRPGEISSNFRMSHVAQISGITLPEKIVLPESEFIIFIRSIGAGDCLCSLFRPEESGMNYIRRNSENIFQPPTGGCGLLPAFFSERTKPVLQRTDGFTGFFISETELIHQLVPQRLSMANQDKPADVMKADRFHL